MLYIEDLLEILSETSSKYSFKFQLEKSDKSLIYSLGRQCCKGIALTDRQHELSKRKLIEYKPQFEKNGLFDIDEYLDNLRLPLRQIDRSRWIKIIDNKLAVRFSFNKKLITALENIRAVLGQSRNFNENIHYFDFTEKSVYTIVSNLENKNFIISNEVLEIYNKCKEYINTPYEYIPYIKDNTFYNFSNKLKDLLVDEIGTPCDNNLYLYKERSHRYNFRVDFDKQVSPILDLILNRNNHFVNFKPSEYQLADVVNSITELKKFPILVILKSGKELSQLREFYFLFSNYIQSKDQSVYFRLDNDDYGIRFNNFIKDNSLNNTIDKNTKIVYINESKLPKPIIKSNWYPSLVLSKESSRLNREIETFCRSYSDLFISTDEIGVSDFKFRTRYGSM